MEISKAGDGGTQLPKYWSLYMGRDHLNCQRRPPPPPVIGTVGFFVPGGRLFGKLKSRRLDLAGLTSAVSQFNGHWRLCFTGTHFDVRMGKKNLVTPSAAFLS